MKQKSSFLRLMDFAKGNKVSMGLSVILAVIGVVCSMAPYFAIAGIIKEFFEFTATVQSILKYFVIALAGETMKMLLTTISSSLAHKVAFHILENIRNCIVDKMMRVPMGVMMGTPSGHFKGMIVDTVERLEKPLAHMLPEITANLFTPVCIAFVLFALDWRMALACLLVAPIGFVILLGQMRDYQNRSRRYMDANSNMDSSLVEYINGIQVIKAFNQAGVSFQKFSDSVKHYHDVTVDWWHDSWIFSSIGMTVIPASVFSGLPIGAIMLMNGKIEFSVFITCLVLSLGIAGPLLQASSYVDRFAIIDASIKQIAEFLDTPELKRPTEYCTLDDSGFVFKDVHFSYGEKEILHGISFVPALGGMTAIVGPSGSGKSTITKLMAGFWDANAGTITYGGKNIQEIPSAQMMEEISFVAQDNFLFDKSIRENIRMGRPDATDEEVEAVAKKARCDVFIKNLEHGYDTMAGDAGKKLSGGERQRITIARAMLKKAKVIILDEASAYADPENEVHIQAAINELVREKTVIVVAHKLSTIKDAARIVVVEDGNIVGIGTQNELLKNCPLYQLMWQEHTLAVTAERSE